MLYTNYTQSQLFDLVSATNPFGLIHVAMEEYQKLNIPSQKILKRLIELGASKEDIEHIEMYLFPELFI